MKYQKITKISKNSEQNNLENDDDNETPKERYISRRKTENYW